MKRIDATQIVEAYQETGMTPKRHCWRKDDCGCGVAALLMAKGHDTENLSCAVAAELLDLGELYVKGFTHGFDGFGLRDKAPETYLNPEFGYGVQDGYAAADAVFKD